MKRIRFLFFPLLFFSVAGHGLDPPTHRYLLILCGIGGTPEYQQKFTEWGARLQKVGSTWYGVTPERFILLTETPDGQNQSATLSQVEEVLEQWKTMATEEDELVVILIGHGSFVRGESKFLLPGPDLLVDRLKELLDGFPAKTQIIVNASSSSAGFINTLSAPGRILCTATKSADENNATEWMDFFLQGFEQGQADANYDQRITLLEACRQASEQTESWYRGKGLLATEHALLDDNGDRRGERLAPSRDPAEKPADETSFDGKCAAQIVLFDKSFPPGASPEWIEAYLAILREIESLKENKKNLSEDEYYRTLETLLLRAAVLHREIRETAATISPPSVDTIEEIESIE